MKSILPAALLLSGCAVCNQHPVACMAGSTLLIGSVELAANRRSDNRSQLGSEEVRRWHLN